jgi:hypothetical protein
VRGALGPTRFDTLFAEGAAMAPDAMADLI